MGKVIALLATAPAVSAPVAKRAAPKTSSNPAPFAKGKGAAERNVSFGTVAIAAYKEGASRAETVNILRDALGAKPAPEAIERCRQEYVVGRVAFRLFVTLPIVDAIAKARDVVLRMAAPAKDGVAARKLRTGQVGRRTVDQHKAVRAADEAWSQLKAEVAPTASNAQTQAERGASKTAKRAPAMKGSTARGAAGSGITHSELVKPDGKPMDRVAARDYIMQMAATMMAFNNKHAGVADTEIATLTKAFRNAVAKRLIEIKAGENVEA